MKVQIFSDAHIDFPGTRGFPPLIAGVSLVVVAGDTCEGLLNSLKRLRAAYPLPTELAVIAGNHEFYGSVWREEVQAGRQIADELKIHFLENSVAVVGTLRIVGATLWTDYDLFGPRLRSSAMLTALTTMRDHKRIKWQKSPWQRFRPNEARNLHLQSKGFIEATLSRKHDGPTLVLSHHAPCLEACPRDAVGDLISAAYASNLYSLIDSYRPDYWVSGHTHVSMDFMISRTRLISNPIGYADENWRFDPHFVLEIA